MRTLHRLSFFFIFLLSALGSFADTAAEITWEDLLPDGFRPEQIMDKYADQLAQLEDGDPASMALFSEIQEALNNAPMNDTMNGKHIKLPGFIAPLDTEGDTITEFLFVPYFGACIHTPPPPINQTIHVTTNEQNGIKPDDAFLPFWLTGTLTTSKLKTDIGEAGYQVKDAAMSEYEM